MLMFVIFSLQVFFASVRSGGSSQVFFMTLNRNSMMNWWWLPSPSTLSRSPIGRPGDPPVPTADLTNEPEKWTLLTHERLKRCRKKTVIVEKNNKDLNKETCYPRSCRVMQKPSLLSWLANWCHWLSKYSYFLCLRLQLFPLFVSSPQTDQCIQVCNSGRNPLYACLHLLNPPSKSGRHLSDPLTPTSSIVLTSFLPRVHPFPAELRGRRNRRIRLHKNLPMTSAGRAAEGRQINSGCRRWERDSLIDFPSPPSLPAATSASSPRHLFRPWVNWIVI